jgi:hypothetical protein
MYIFRRIIGISRRLSRLAFAGRGGYADHLYSIARACA